MEVNMAGESVVRNELKELESRLSVELELLYKIEDVVAIAGRGAISDDVKDAIERKLTDIGLINRWKVKMVNDPSVMILDGPELPGAKYKFKGKVVASNVVEDKVKRKGSTKRGQQASVLRLLYTGVAKIEELVRITKFDIRDVKNVVSGMVSNGYAVDNAGEIRLTVLGANVAKVFVENPRLLVLPLWAKKELLGKKKE